MILAETSIVFELLIGGPNQSHKVNFKELPVQGKSFSKHFGHFSVNTFSGKIFRFPKWNRGKNRILTSFAHRRYFLSDDLIEGKGDGASCDHLRKPFFADFPKKISEKISVERTQPSPPSTSTKNARSRTSQNEGTRNME